MIRKFTITRKNICYFIFLLYLIAISSYQLGVGFDAIFVRITFVLLVIACLLLSKKIKINNLLKLGLLFWTYYFLSILWARNYNDTLYYVNSFIQVIGIFISIPLMIDDEKDINNILKLIVISLLYACFRLILKTPSNIWGTDFVGESIGLHRNALGMRLSICFIICIYFFHNLLKLEKKDYFKIILVVCISVFFASIALLTGSKKALLSIILGFVSYELINSKGIEIFSKIFLGCIFGIMVVYLIFNNSLLYSALGSRIEHLFLTITRSAGRSQIDGSLLERRFYISKAKELFFTNPLLGYGGNNFVTYMREIGYDHIAYSHNNYWELLSTLGIIGFLLYYFIWIKSLLQLLKLKKKNKSNLILLFIIILMLILILDYGNVSYITEFNMIILSIIFSEIYYINKNYI